MTTNYANRAAMVPISRRVRAYFAAVERTSASPAIFDPGKSGLFALEDPPAPWVDLGWIDNFQRVSLPVNRRAHRRPRSRWLIRSILPLSGCPSAGCGRTNGTTSS